MKRTNAIVWVLMGMMLFVASQSDAAAVTNWDFQAVNANGTSAWSGSYPITITGVILNNPEDMLNTAYDPSAVTNNTMGAQWQLFIQGIDGDHNGTALWMGQNYNSIYAGIGTYDSEAWVAEMLRVNYNAADSHQFRQGDLVTVTVSASKFYGGKRNINEDHNTATSKNFTITLVTADFGLPAAEEITLADLYVNSSIAGYDAAYPLFDATRETGAEYYQGMYVKLTGLSLTDAAGWGESAWADRLCIVTDGQGHSFTLRMPLSDLGDAPTGEFDVYGIINQESGSGSNGRVGYEIFVTSVVPEPASLILLTLGGLLVRKRRRCA